MLPREDVVEEGGAEAAEVECARGGGCEAQEDGLHACVAVHCGWRRWGWVFGVCVCGFGGGVGVAKLVWERAGLVWGGQSEAWTARGPGSRFQATSEPLFIS